MKRLVSCLMAALLVLALSVPAYSYTADDLANKLYSGWSQTSSPSGLGGSWYAIVRQFLNSLDSNVSTIKTNSNSIVSKLDSIINSYLHYIDADTSNISTNSNSIVTALGASSYGTVTYQLKQMRDLLTEIKNKSNAWTSVQALSVTSDVSSINSDVSSINSDTSNLVQLSDYLKSGTWWNASSRRFITPSVDSGYNSSWYSAVGGLLQQSYSAFAYSSLNVTSLSDMNLGKQTFQRGVYGTLYRLQQVLADDDDLQLKADTDENKTAARDNFLSPDSSTSVSASDIGGLSNLGTELRSNFSTGSVEASSLFDFWGSDNTFSWFTQETKNNMVNVSSSGSGARRARAQNENDEPIYYSPYGEHMEEYERLMREGIK